MDEATIESGRSSLNLGARLAWLFIASHLACGLALADSPQAATRTTSQQTAKSFPHVPEVREVKKRAANGRLEEFADSANRTFALRFRDDGKIESVGAVRGRHASDIHRIVYAPSGALLQVLLGNGYALHFAYADNGTQLIRDQFGGVITRGDPTKPPGTQTLQSDPSGKLQPTLAGLDALLAAVSQ